MKLLLAKVLVNVMNVNTLLFRMLQVIMCAPNVCYMIARFLEHIYSFEI